MPQAAGWYYSEHTKGEELVAHYYDSPEPHGESVAHPPACGFNHAFVLARDLRRETIHSVRCASCLRARRLAKDDL